jgi:hypothetical protein
MRRGFIVGHVKTAALKVNGRMPQRTSCLVVANWAVFYRRIIESLAYIESTATVGADIFV